MSDDELTDDELTALLTRVWPEIRYHVWLSLPAHMRRVTIASSGPGSPPRP